MLITGLSVSSELNRSWKSSEFLGFFRFWTARIWSRVSIRASLADQQLRWRQTSSLNTSQVLSLGPPAPPCSPNPPGTRSYKTVNFLQIHLFNRIDPWSCFLLPPPGSSSITVFAFYVSLLLLFLRHKAFSLIFFLLFLNLCQVWRSKQNEDIKKKLFQILLLFSEAVKRRRRK